MPPKPRMYINNLNSSKKKLQPKPCGSTNLGTASGLSPEAEDQFEVELCWCIQQLQMCMTNEKLQEKQMHNLEKNINILKSNSAPLIKKRQIMRNTLGNYREKMILDEQKLSKPASMVKFVTSSTSNKKSVFLRKATDRSKQHKEDSSQDKEDSSQDKENSSQDKENSSQDTEDTSQNKENSSQDKEDTSQNKENSSQGKKDSSQDKENSSQGKKDSSQDKENSSPDKEYSSQGKENSSQNKEDSSQDKEDSFQDKEEVTKTVLSKSIIKCNGAEEPFKFNF